MRNLTTMIDKRALMVVPAFMAMSLVLDSLGVKGGVRMVLMFGIMLFITKMMAKTPSRVGQPAGELDGLKVVTGDDVQLGSGLVLVELW